MIPWPSYHVYIEGTHVFIVNALAYQKTISGPTAKKEVKRNIRDNKVEEEIVPAYNMLLSGKFLPCGNKLQTISQTCPFYFTLAASFISSQGSALEISDRKQIEMLNRAFDIRPHNIQYLKQGPYDEVFCQYETIPFCILWFSDWIYSSRVSITHKAGGDIGWPCKRKVS